MLKHKVSAVMCTQTWQEGVMSRVGYVEIDGGRLWAMLKHEQCTSRAMHTSRTVQAPARHTCRPDVTRSQSISRTGSVQHTFDAVCVAQCVEGVLHTAGGGADVGNHHRARSVTQERVTQHLCTSKRSTGECCLAPPQQYIRQHAAQEHSATSHTPSTCCAASTCWQNHTTEQT